MLSAAKHLCARRDRYFAEFTLERSEGLSMTELDLSNAEKLSSSFEPGLKRYAYRRLERKGSACETGSYRHCPRMGRVSMAVLCCLLAATILAACGNTTPT